MINKCGQIGFSIITIYRILLVVIISVVLLGISSVAYAYHINIRDSEALLMIREISDCVISDSVVNVDELRGENLFEYCGLDDFEVKRFFVSLSVNVSSAEVLKLESGDSGLLWVKDVYDGVAKTDSIEKYRPGHFKKWYSVFVLDDGVEKDGSIIVEVVVKNE